MRIEGQICPSILIPKTFNHLHTMGIVLDFARKEDK
jgi:hypothetical protein